MEEENLDPLAEIDTNQLTELGNRAVKLKLIAGHGFHKGRYELLRKGEVITLSPKEAIVYLKLLINEAES
jgi:hypothetical protein